MVDAPTHSTVLNAGSRMPVFEVGESIDDFDLLGVLGKGAFATVFRARQKSLLRIVALKISRDQGFEPQTLAQLEHPNIVRVFDQRQIAEHKLRLLYMQYVAGGTLHDVLTYLREHPSTERNGGTLLAAVDAALVRNGESPSPRLDDALPAAKRQLAASGLLARIANGRSHGPCPSGRRAAPRYQAGQRSGWFGYAAQTGRLQHQLFQTRRCDSRRFFWGNAGLHVPPSNWKPTTPRTSALPRRSTPAATSTRWAWCCGNY